jgi:hypothetical protein
VDSCCGTLIPAVMTSASVMGSMLASWACPAVSVSAPEALSGTLKTLEILAIGNGTGLGILQVRAVFDPAHLRVLSARRLVLQISGKTPHGAERQQRTHHPQDGAGDVGALRMAQHPAGVQGGAASKASSPTATAWPDMMAGKRSRATSKSPFHPAIDPTLMKRRSLYLSLISQAWTLV